MKRSRLMWSLGLVVATLVASAAHAQPTAGDTATARALLLDGREKMKKEDYAGALKDFQGAHAIMGVPTTGLDLAKAQAALGQLLEARETALSVSRMPSKPGESSAFAEARKKAEDLAKQLEPRIPSVTIAIVGPAADAIEVRLNSAVIAVATLGLPRKVNPGRNTITVTAPSFATETRTVDVKEGQTLPIEITMQPAGAPTAAPSASVSAAPSVTAVSTAAAATVSATAEVTAAPTATAAPDRSTPPWAWVAGGAGLVALGVGAAFFVDYLGVRDTVAKDCPNNVCDPAKHDAASAQGLRAQWNRDLGLTIGLGAVALAGIGVAIAGFASTSSKASPQAGPRVQIRAGAGGLSVEGAF